MTNGTDLVKPKLTDLTWPDGRPKIAPVQGYAQGIPWSLHLKAYNVYCKRYGEQEAMIDLEGRGCRGGFGVGELDMFIPGWRDEVEELALLRTRATLAESSLAVAMKRLGEVEVPRPLEEWHEDMGDQLWWKFPIVESPYCGSPLDLGQTVEAHGHIGLLSRFQVGGWPGYHTHFTPIPRIATIANEATEKENGRG